MDETTTFGPFDLFEDENVTSMPVLTLHNKPNTRMTVIKVVYAIGIIGNAMAIVALRWGERRMRNRKHLLLLTALAANDLVALIGMMCAMLVAEHVHGARETRMYCVARVVLRVFGIGSVCIAVTMALERYLALTRPFFYQKHVTYFVIRLSLFVSWVFAAVLTCMPIIGFGLYYDEGICVRYRNAVTTLDFSYATIYIAFGTLLCVILVVCNLAVIQALYSISAPRAGGPPVVRRVSRSSCRQKSLNSSGSKPSLHHNEATAEEVAFSRLMATLSVLFFVCWIPQMVTSAVYLALGKHYWKKLAWIANLSDMLMLLNYVLNPFLYVFMRQRRTIYHTVTHCFKGGHKTSTESMTMKTSCCPQETLVVSDSSVGAEMKPLRSLPANYQNAPLVRIED